MNKVTIVTAKSLLTNNGVKLICFWLLILTNSFKIMKIELKMVSNIGCQVFPISTKGTGSIVLIMGITSARKRKIPHKTGISDTSNSLKYFLLNNNVDKFNDFGFVFFIRK